jgi:hypothetical protein
MRLCRSWLALGLLPVLAGPPAVRAAVIYKWTDADGVLHFSDQPVPGAEKIITPGGNTHGISSQPAPASGPMESAKTQSRLASTELSITSPAQGQTFSGADVPAAQLSMQPEAPSDHPLSIIWTLNGAPVSEADGATSFVLPSDLPRGTYTLAVTVTDSQTGESKSAEPVTFNVLRPGLLSPKRK